MTYKNTLFIFYTYAMYIKIPDLSFIIIDINVFNGHDYISYLDYDVYSVLQ